MPILDYRQDGSNLSPSYQGCEPPKQFWHDRCKGASVKTAIRNFSLGLILGTSALAGPVFYAQTSVLLKKVDEHLEKILAEAGQAPAGN